MHFLFRYKIERNANKNNDKYFQLRKNVFHVYMYAWTRESKQFMDIYVLFQHKANNIFQLYVINVINMW